MLQTKPHVVPSHAAVPLAGTGHAAHELPHVAVDRFETQARPQRCVSAAQAARFSRSTGVGADSADTGKDAAPKTTVTKTKAPRTGRELPEAT